LFFTASAAKATTPKDTRLRINSGKPMAPKFSFAYLVLTRLFVAIGLFVTSLETGANAQTQNAAQWTVKFTR
jgi:hypothetical protein